MRSHVLLALCLPLLTSCFARPNPEYCAENSDCATNSYCALPMHRCMEISKVGEGDLGAGGLALNDVSPHVAVSNAVVSMTLTGTQFMPGMQVEINGVMATTVLVDPSGESATVQVSPSGTVCGPVSIKLTNPDGHNVTRADLFRFGFAGVNFNVMNSGIVQRNTNSMGVISRGATAEFALTNSGANPLEIVQLGGGTGLISTLYPLTSTPLNKIFVLELDDYVGKLPDLITFASSGFIAWQGLASHAFSHPQGVQFTVQFGSAAAADLNRNTLPDLILTNGAAIDIYPSDSQFSYQTASLTTLATPGGQMADAVAAADLNDDGNTDVVVTLPGSMQVAIYFGRGNLVFNPPQTLSVSGRPTQLFVLNIDGDKDQLPEIVTVSAAGTLTILLNRVGTFLPAQTLALGTMADTLSFADLNCDELPDLIYAHRMTAGFSVRRNSGAAPFFSDVNTFNVGDPVNQIAAYELSGDKLADVIVQTANATTDNLTVYRTVGQ